jgi:hypothetical protein
MQQAATGGASVRLDGQHDTRHSIVADLISLIGHVEASLDLLEAAIACEAVAGSQDAGNAVVLDDVTPRYVRAKAALNTCNAGLGAALHLLLDNGTAIHPFGEGAAGRRHPVHSIPRA